MSRHIAEPQIIKFENGPRSFREEYFKNQDKDPCANSRFLESYFLNLRD